MRGSPLLRALLAFLVILLAGYPLWRLTGDAASSAPPLPTAPLASVKDISLQLNFTTIPKTVKVRQLGKEIWGEATPGAEMHRKLALPFPVEGIDLQFQVEFSDGAPLAAMRVKLTDPAGDEHEKSLWGTGSIDDVLTFP